MWVMLRAMPWAVAIRPSRLIKRADQENKLALMGLWHAQIRQFKWVDVLGLYKPGFSL